MNTKLNFKQSLTAGALAAGVAAILNTALFYVFHGAGIIVDTIVIQPEQPMTVVPIIIASILPAFLGSMVFFLFEKYAKNGFKVFTIVSAVLMVLSFANPFLGIPNVTTGYAIALNVMHVTVVAALLYFINSTRKKNVAA